MFFYIVIYGTCALSADHFVEKLCLIAFWYYVILQFKPPSTGNDGGMMQSVPKRAKSGKIEVGFYSTRISQIAPPRGSGQYQSYRAYMGSIPGLHSLRILGEKRIFLLFFLLFFYIF